MTTYVLDTSVLIDASRDREPGASWLQRVLVQPHSVAVSAVTVAEFFAGLEPRERGGWSTFIETLTHWDTTREIAIQAGIFRYDAARRGQVIQIPDALIAATAMVVGATLATSNVRHFGSLGVPIVRLDA